jgi:hypothetical protein
VGISRRSFLDYATRLPAALAIAASSGAAPRFSEAGGSLHAGRTRAGVASTQRYLLLNFSCVLDESFEGYRASLKSAGLPFEITRRETTEAASFIVVPAAALTELCHAGWLRNRIAAGATALVESGGAFLPSSEFRVQQFLVRTRLGVSALAPVRLWENAGRLSNIPYVDFTWPAAATIRDFSRVVPLSGVDAQAMATQGTRVVGLKRRLGAGMLVYLGSPVGPHLLAGDHEAQRWFEKLCLEDPWGTSSPA